MATLISISTGYDSIPKSIVIADFDNDGRMNIAVTGYGTNNVRIFLAYSNGNFTKQMRLSTEIHSASNSIAFDDFNDNNALDNFALLIQQVKMLIYFLDIEMVVLPNN